MAPRAMAWKNLLDPLACSIMWEKPVRERS